VIHRSRSPLSSLTMRLLGIHRRRAVVVQHTAMMLLCLYARKLSLGCCETQSAWRCDVFYDRSDGSTSNGQLCRLQPWLNAMKSTDLRRRIGNSCRGCPTDGYSSWRSLLGIRDRPRIITKVFVQSVVRLLHATVCNCMKFRPR
jgi:hypothetical protein